MLKAVRKAEGMKIDEGVLTPEMKAEVQARLEKSWSEKYDVPSQAPGFEGATPQALARGLFNLERKS